VIRVINKGGWETEHYEAVQLQKEEFKTKVRDRKAKPDGFFILKINSPLRTRTKSFKTA
jgi:hypothetical protein